MREKGLPRRTRIEPALRVPADLRRDVAMAAMLAEYVAILEACVLRSPDQFPLPYVITDQRAGHVRADPPPEPKTID